MKILLTSLLLTLSINLYAEGCNNPDWVFPPKMEGKVLVLRIKGTCTLDRIGTFNSLRDHFVKNVTQNSEVVKVHQINENTTLGNLPATDIDSTLDLKNKDGNMTVRFLTKVGTDGQDHFIYDQDSKEFVKASGNAKYVRRLYFNYDVKTSGGGVVIEVVQETKIQSPGMFESIFIKEATKAVKNTFVTDLPRITKEISDNF
jgi:hypothetical protein